MFYSSIHSILCQTYEMFKSSDMHISILKNAQFFHFIFRHNNCLGEDSSGSSVTNGVVKPFLSVPPGQIMNVHGQCQEIYGNTSFMCVCTLL